MHTYTHFSQNLIKFFLDKPFLGCYKATYKTIQDRSDDFCNTNGVSSGNSRAEIGEQNPTGKGGEKRFKPSLGENLLGQTPKKMKSGGK